MSRFRITAWPAAQLPEPLVWQGDHQLSSDGTITCYLRDHPVALPQEAFLRGLTAVDADDRDAVVEFLNAHGTIYLGPKLNGWFDFRERYLLDPRASEAANWRAIARDLNRAGPAVWPVSAAIEDLRISQALVEHWRRSESNEDVRPAWRTAGYRTRTVEQAWRDWSMVMNRSLDPFAPQVVPHTNTRREPLGLPPVTLSSGLAVQLFNAVVEGLPPLMCANETCRLPFIRQQGRAEAEQYKTRGVAYCSKSCARSQAQREWRRRQR